MDIKGSVGPREIKSVHQLLHPALVCVSNCQQLTLCSWWMQSLCARAAPRFLLSPLIEAVKQKVLHRGWQSRSVNCGAERWQPLRRKSTVPSQRGPAEGSSHATHSSTSQHVKCHASCLNSSQHLSWSEARDRSRSGIVTFTGSGLKTGRVLLDLFFFVVDWVTQLWQATLFILSPPNPP